MSAWRELRALVATVLFGWAQRADWRTTHDLACGVARIVGQSDRRHGEVLASATENTTVLAVAGAFERGDLLRVTRTGEMVLVGAVATGRISVFRAIESLPVPMAPGDELMVVGRHA